MKNPVLSENPGSALCLRLMVAVEDNDVFLPGVGSKLQRVFGLSFEERYFR